MARPCPYSLTVHATPACRFRASHRTFWLPLTRAYRCIPLLSRDDGCSPDRRFPSRLSTASYATEVCATRYGPRLPRRPDSPRAVPLSAFMPALTDLHHWTASPDDFYFTTSNELPPRGRGLSPSIRSPSHRDDSASWRHICYAAV